MTKRRAARDIVAGDVLTIDGSDRVVDHAASGRRRTVLVFADGLIQVRPAGEAVDVLGHLADHVPEPMPDAVLDYEVVEEDDPTFLVVPWVEDGERLGITMTQVRQGRLVAIRDVRVTPGVGDHDALDGAVEGIHVAVGEVMRVPGADLATLDPAFTPPDAVPGNSIA